MPKFIIVTKIPPRQTLVGYTKVTYTIDETERDSVEEVKTRLHVPLGGYCMIINEDDITWVSSKIINEVEPKPREL